jgi:hypothetical protein
VNVDALVAAAERAIALGGAVMLSLRGDDHRWCAICAAVDGSIELRVGEPSRSWRRWRPAAGEAWLRDHGFVHVIDAWAAPAVAGASTRVYAELLASALRDGLGTPDDRELVEVLLHPGVMGDAEPPPSAPHAEHIRYAVTALAAHGRGKLDIQGGRPAATWAWVSRRRESWSFRPSRPTFEATTAATGPSASTSATPARRRTNSRRSFTTNSAGTPAIRSSSRSWSFEPLSLTW